MRRVHRGVLLTGAAVVAVGTLAACGAVQHTPLLPAVQEPALNEADVVMRDGVALPLRVWQPAGAPRAVLLGLHGFNDHARAYAPTGEYLARHGIITYAYDQRGFGAAPFRGLWTDHRRLAADARTVIDLLRARHPGLPVYLMGESMGGAVALISATEQQASVDGLVLAAPAVWGRASMNPLQRLLLGTLVRVAPGLTVTGAGLRITASDNAEMLQALRDDPLIIRRTRVDAIHGMVNLMDAAAASAAQLNLPTLILYGARDEIIPPGPTCHFLRALPAHTPARLAFYPEGYHLLTRDLQAEVVLADIAHWLLRADAPLPSGLELDPPRWTEALC
ncbi:lysophospholipase [Ectothiorhodospiraceae bacterium 2226]|nr:lysophospholipase [Ectothiorhodospiraceae bacterium 2226]